jgi:four helix bundle protein
LDFGFWILDFGFWSLEVVMTEVEFKQRTKAAALRAIRVVEALPRSVAADVLGKQLIRCATSVGANYRAACRARSTADMLSKLAIVEEEGDETLYWLELIIEAELLSKARLAELAQEYDQIVAMIVASQKTLRRNNPKPRSR